jgi:hypothetical protein
MQNFLYTLFVGNLTPSTEHHRVYKLARSTFILAQHPVNGLGLVFFHSHEQQHVICELEV